MTQNPWFPIGLILVAGMSVFVTAVLLLREARHRDLETRILAIASGAGVDYRTVGLSGIAGLLHSIGDWIRKSKRFYSESDLAGLESLIATSGFNARRILPIVLGGKVVLMALIPSAAILYCYVAAPSLGTGSLVIAAAVAAGMLGPDWLLSLIRRPHAAALQRGVIDALDLLVVCSEAGLGLESALEQVAREMQHSNRPTASALAELLDELRVLPDRRLAFANFARRSGVDGMQRLATMLAQSMQYGTPLGQVLRAVADQLRQERMTKLEERAAKLPAKLVLPLILFIMPCLFIILVGSSFMRLYEVLPTLTHH